TNKLILKKKKGKNMSYPNFQKESSTCANCGNALFNDGEFTNQSYLTIRDNFMIVNFFQFEDGTDNMFCDANCLASFLSAEEVEILESE
ncbi:hypothetical protein AAH971_14800, partial [Enterococcus faecalis]